MSDKKNHRREAEGRKPKGRRMPKTDEIKMGTRIHDNYEERHNEEIPEIDKCPICDCFTEVEDLLEYNGICHDCWLIEQEKD